MEIVEIDAGVYLEAVVVLLLLVLCVYVAMSFDTLRRIERLLKELVEPS